MGLVPGTPGDGAPGALEFALRYELLTSRPLDVASVDVRADLGILVYPVADSDVAVEEIVDEAAQRLAADGWDVDELVWTLGDDRAWSFATVCEAFGAIVAAMDHDDDILSLVPLGDGRLEVTVADEAAAADPALEDQLARAPGMIEIIVDPGAPVWGD